MSRRTEVLDAALAVLAAGGARGLTHQAVDRAAGVPAGTTSNSFRTRATLLHGVLAHLVELDRADWDLFARRPMTSVDEVAVMFADLARHSVGPGMPRSRARFALFLESASHPELAALLAQGRVAVLDWGTALLSGLGASEPRTRARGLAAHLDGVLLHHLAFPNEPFDPLPGFRAVLTQ